MSWCFISPVSAALLLSILEFTLGATEYFAGGGKWKNLADRSMITSMSNSMFAQAIRQAFWAGNL